MGNDHITVGSNSYEKVENFKELGCLLPNENSTQEEIKRWENFIMRFGLIKKTKYKFYVK